MPSITRRRAAALSALLAGAGLLLATGCSDQAAALRVGDQSYSDTDLRDELDAFAGNDLLPFGDESIRGAAVDSYDQAFVSQILGQRVTFMLGEQIFDDEGLRLDDESRATASQRIDEQLQGGLDGFPDDFRAALVDDVARLVVLEDELGASGLSDALEARVGDVDIEVSSRFGSWDGDTFTVVPPEGPVDAQGSDPGDPTEVPGG